MGAKWGAAFERERKGWWVPCCTETKRRRHCGTAGITGAVTVCNGLGQPCLVALLQQQPCCVALFQQQQRGPASAAAVLRGPVSAAAAWPCFSSSCAAWPLLQQQQQRGPASAAWWRVVSVGLDCLTKSLETECVFCTSMRFVAQYCAPRLRCAAPLPTPGPGALESHIRGLSAVTGHVLTRMHVTVSRLGHDSQV